MFASDKDATEKDRGKVPPQFKMYGPGESFHSAWSSWHADPVTVVIEPL